MLVDYVENKFDREIRTINEKLKDGDEEEKSAPLVRQHQVDNCFPLNLKDFDELKYAIEKLGWFNKWAFRRATKDVFG